MSEPLDAESVGPATGTAPPAACGRPAGTAARTPYEEGVLTIWREVLDRQDIGLGDDFFDLDGDSLQAIQVIGRIRQTWGVGIGALTFFEAPTVAELAASVAGAVAAGVPSDRPPVRRRPDDAPALPSIEQQRLWLESQLRPGATYNVHHRQRLVGALDRDALEASIRGIVARHESLRTRFPTVDGRPVQVVDDPDEGWRLRTVEVPPDDADAAALLADEDASTGFDLERGPLLRCLLVRESETSHVLSVTAHHIICDAWSIGLFARELAALYRAGGDPARARLPELTIQYRDFSAWQHAWLAGDELERQVGYWRRHLEGSPAALALPTGYRPVTDGAATPTAGGRVRRVLAPQRTAAMQRLCLDSDVTPFMVLLAGLATVLSRWSGQRDVVVGVPITGRTDVGTENLVGFFVNTLPLRVDLSGDPTFADLLDRVRRAALDGYAHADAPLDLLVDQLRAVRVPGRTPLFQVALNMVDFREVEQLPGLTTQPMATPAAPSKFDLALTAVALPDRFQFEMEFDARRSLPAMVEALIDQVVTLLEHACAEPGRRLFGSPSAPAAGPPAGDVAPRPPAAPADLGRHADAVAVVDAAGTPWTYAQLAAALTQAGPGGTGTATVGVAPGFDDVVRLLGQDPAAPGTDPLLERLTLCAGDRVTILSSRPGQLRCALTTALSAGATVLLCDLPLDGDPAAVAAWLQDRATTVLHTTPPVLRALAAHAPTGALAGLRRVVVAHAGDLLTHDVEALRAAAPSCGVVAVYLAGRHHVPAAAYAVPSSGAVTAPGRLPLGAPLEGVPLLLVHPDGSAAATGEVAEMWLGPDGTGDLGRRWTDGTLEYVGRADPADPALPVETVAALRELPGVRDALVMAGRADDGRPVLTGYVVGSAVAGSPDGQRQLLTRLPEPQVPRHVVGLDRIPLTTGGEYDLDRLPAPGADDEADTYVAARTPVEEGLTQILHDLLAVDRIGVYDSYFELGLSSLLATRLTSRLLATFGVEVSLLELFESATVERLANLVVVKQAALSDADDLAALLDELGR